MKVAQMQSTLLSLPHHRRLIVCRQAVASTGCLPMDEEGQRTRVRARAIAGVAILLAAP